MANLEARSREDCPRLASDTEEFTDHFYEVLDEARAQCPVAWDDTYGRYFVTGYEAVGKVTSDWEAFSSATSVAGVFGMPPLLPVEVDPPVHKAWRQVLNPWFTPGVVRTLNASVLGTVDALIDAFRTQRRCEAVAQLCRPLPAQVLFADILEFTPEEVARSRELADMFVDDDLLVRLHGLVGLHENGEAMVRARRSHASSDDLFGSIIQAKINGEPASDRDAGAVIAALILGGMETTPNVLSSALLHLATHPDDQAMLRADPSLLPASTDEFVRLCNPAIQLLRCATREVEVEGVTVPAGAPIAVSFAAANRDPAIYENPHTFSPTRGAKQHMGFGWGIHYCVGAHLARLMIKVALARLLEEFDSFRLAPDFVPEYEVMGVRGLKRLDLVFD